MLRDLFNYSFRNLRNKRLRTWLTLLGIVIGIASVIALIGLGNGLREAILAQFSVANTDIITVQAGGAVGGGPPGTGVVTPLTQKQVDQIDRISSVDLAIGRMINTVRVEFNDIQGIDFATSVPEDKEKRRVMEDILNIMPISGRFLEKDDRGRVFLGYNFAKSDNKFKKVISTGNHILINGRSFQVSGIMKKKGSFIFDNVIFMNEPELREITNDPENIDLIAVRVKSPADLDRAKVAIEKFLRKERNVEIGEEDFSVQTPQASLQTVNSVLGGVQTFVILVAAISMIVGSIGIINTMFTAVLERRKEIGIMKAIGAKNSDIFLLFLIESGLLGGVGGLLGILMGTGAAFAGTTGLNALLGLSAAPGISMTLIVLSFSGSIFIGSISGIVPAMQAAKLPPVLALRG